MTESDERRGRVREGYKHGARRVPNLESVRNANNHSPAFWKAKLPLSRISGIPAQLPDYADFDNKFDVRVTACYNWHRNDKAGGSHGVASHTGGT